MRARLVAVVIVLGLSGCTSGAPTRPGVDGVDRAREIAEQVEERQADLEERGSSD